MPFKVHKNEYHHTRLPHITRKPSFPSASVASDVANDPGKNITHWYAPHPTSMDLASPISYLGSQRVRVPEAFINFRPSAQTSSRPKSISARFHPRDFDTEEMIVGEVEQKAAWFWSRTAEVGIVSVRHRRRARFGRAGWILRLDYLGILTGISRVGLSRRQLSGIARIAFRNPRSFPHPLEVLLNPTPFLLALFEIEEEDEPGSTDFEQDARLDESLEDQPDELPDEPDEPPSISPRKKRGRKKISFDESSAHA